MLILTRRAGESIYIGDNIKVKVLNAERGQARIGIEAPKDVPVNREEIWRAKDRTSKRRGNSR